MSAKKVTKEVENVVETKATVCDVIQFLDKLEKPLNANCTYAPRSLECVVDDERNEITGFLVRMPGDDACSSAEYDSFSIEVLGVDFKTDSYKSYDYDGADCWEIPSDLEIGDTSVIRDVLEKMSCDKNDDGSYSKEDIHRVLRELLTEKTSCNADDYEYTEDEVLDAIYDVSSVFYSNSEYGGVFISTDWREEGVRYHRIGAARAARELLESADFEYAW